MDDDETTSDRPVTATALLKAIAISTGTLGVVVSVVWFFGSLQNQITELKGERDQDKTSNEMVIRQVQSDIDETKKRESLSEKSQAEMSSKLDVALVILERIDKRVSISVSQ